MKDRLIDVMKANWIIVTMTYQHSVIAIQSLRIQNVAYIIAHKIIAYKGQTELH